MKRNTVKDLCLIAVFAAIISIVGQFSIPLPGGVPMTLQTLIVALAGAILGSRKGFWSTLIYILIGAVGVPVFAGWTGGIGVIMGMTGGFLVSFPLIALFTGLGDEIGTRLSASAGPRARKILSSAGLLIGVVVGYTVNYAVGSLWFMAVTQANLATALTACVLPFIPTSILKAVLVLIVGPVLKRSLEKAHVLEVRRTAAV
jgi:biotin transport system substrate-specific component